MVAEVVVDRSIQRGSVDQALHLSPPQVVVVGVMFQHAARRHHARQDRVSHAETGERVLKSCLLTRHQVVSTAGCCRYEEIARATVEARMLHLETEQTAEAVDGALDVGSLLGKTLEHAALDRATTAHHQKIGVATRREGIVEDQPEAVCEGCLEVVADRDDAGRTRAGGQDTRAGQLVLAAAETQLDPQRQGLIEQRAVEAAAPRAALHEIADRRRTAQGVAAVPGIEADTVGAGRHNEIGRDSRTAQNFEHVALARPVLEALKITLEAMADLALRFMQHNLPAAPRKRDRGSQTGGSGAHDLDWRELLVHCGNRSGGFVLGHSGVVFVR
ncbi:hypothetical protein ACCAA_670037 [Candidatus Accumulibacter aalborgensis]|uniref:Uncharacterized protein n=1 Tax=Candidatus Accumulibacter aalborgensis TaxID=1860102 RepID=A0A1A8XVR6_9PROT|nr:hypothetical protein ACCAA_670037 [Candidatus Accumulibacter aalborgensis]